MALLGMAVWDTESNQRSELTEKTLQSLSKTVDFTKHELWVVDNKSCDKTLEIYNKAKNWLPINVIYNDSNRGTARALNKVIAKRHSTQNVCKIDNDVVIHHNNWLDELEEAIDRDSNIGICALKRRDLLEKPSNPEGWYKSELKMLDHVSGQKWIIVEQTLSCIGTCTLFNYRLLDKIGYSRQDGLYGLEDVEYSTRAYCAGFYCCFLPHIYIEHIDHVPNEEYQKWKHKESGTYFAKYQELMNKYIEKEIPIYVEYND